MTDRAVDATAPAAPVPPLVSVIIPLYNMADWIAETLESVLGQIGFSAFEVLVVDDRSADHTADIVARIAQRDGRVQLLHNSGARGAAAARNLAVQQARGEWLAFVDGDDLWMPDNLRLKMDAARAHPGVDIISSDFYNENRANRTVPKAQWPELLQSLTPAWQCQLGPAPSGPDVQVLELTGLVDRFLRHEVLGNTGTMVVRRVAVQTLGGFDTRLEVGEDVFLWLQLAQRSDRMLLVRQPLLFYRFRPGSLTNQGYPAHAFFTDKFLTMLLKRPAFAQHRPLVRMRLARALLEQCVHWRRVADRRKALAVAGRLVAGWPAMASGWRSLAAVMLGR